MQREGEIISVEVLLVLRPSPIGPRAVSFAVASAAPGYPTNAQIDGQLIAD